ncbi:MAG: type IX secretion system sortase PorU [Bacteroidetes bacterium]|nr:type IX secretion system sortase PorU [Bacteroidota bacterium]
MNSNCFVSTVAAVFSAAFYIMLPPAGMDVTAQAVHHTIQWLPPAKHQLTETYSLNTLSFTGCSYDFTYGNLPVWHQKIKLQNPNTPKLDVSVTNMAWETVPGDELSLIRPDELALITVKPEIRSLISAMRLVPYGSVSFIPLRKNPGNGTMERLLSFDITVNPAEFKAKAMKANTYSSNSVLATGNWYKFNIQSDGIYQITYSWMQQAGMDVANIDPRNIRIYGNGGGILPLANSSFRYDDLTENAIWISGEADGNLGTGDYALFYAKGPDTWKYNSTNGLFEHTDNIYSRYAFYFITADLGPGKRIATQPSETVSPTHTVTSFNDFVFYEKNSVNFLKSGREWFGEEFDILTSYNFSFQVPNLDYSVPLTLKAEVYLRSLQPATFDITANGTQVLTITPNKLNSLVYTDTYANGATGTGLFTPSSSNMIVNISFAKNGQATCTGWLNYITLNSIRLLTLSGVQQILFRDVQSADTGNAAEFIISGISSTDRVWEVTDPLNPKEQAGDFQGTQFIFRAKTDTLRTFAAFKNSGFPSPSSGTKIPNQDLHGLTSYGTKQPDLIIVTPSVFLTQAQRLATHHTDFDKMNVIVVQQDHIFNEFSSGAQDVAAVRDFIKMIYDRAAGETGYLPKYVCLFGDGSYDPLDRMSNNTNFIITYEAGNSTNPISSYVSDDFFASMDYEDGGSELYGDYPDVGIGRLVAKTAEEAETFVDKIIRYATDPGAMRDWRNWVLFVGDDEDNNLHISQANTLATKVDTEYNNYNVDKIYLDAYVQTSSTGGQRYPDAERDLLNRIDRGALTVNWTGHGGEVSWAHERILEVPEINGMQNINNLPCFFTATCEFARYDDPERTAAGELVVLNPNGGGIAALFTTRLAFANENFNLNTAFYNVVFEDLIGDFPRLGDVNRLTKFYGSNASPNLRNFHLLGDPALRLAYPVHRVVTTTINNKPVGTVPDTVKALNLVTISGYIQDKYSETKMTGFNGIVYLSVFDKAETKTTLVNDPASKPFTFILQKNLIYKGKSRVRSGDFSFTFLIPKDISYKPGFGRMSFYATDSVTDGSGSFENFIIGGTADTVISDNTGPEIDLYMNDENFVAGGITDENPYLLVKLFDENSINTVGNAIGHDLTAILDNNTGNSIVLNDYYESDLDSYKSGEAKYRFTNLSEGRHALKVKAFDALNNSSEGEVEFIVASSAEMALNMVLNYPNPFTTRTSFMFEHNKPGQELDVQIQIFTVSGKLVKTIDASLTTTGYNVGRNMIDWNGRDDYGDKIGRGVYIYRLKVQSPDGLKADKLEKLVILN